MAVRLFKFGLLHRGVVTVALLGALLLNLLVMVRLQPPDPLKGDLPLAARCQGGGPGCTEQPLIPPPAGGLPHFDAPPAAVFGQLVAVEPAALVAVHEPPPYSLERPPTSLAAA